MRQVDISFLRRRLAERKRFFEIAVKDLIGFSENVRRPTRASQLRSNEEKNFRRRKREFFSQREALSDKFSNAGSEREKRKRVLSQLITAFYRRTRRVTGIRKTGAAPSPRSPN